MTQEELRNQAALLMLQIWQGIGSDLKSRYRMSIWDQFENQIRSAAYTNNLGKFVNSLCSKLDATVGKNAEGRAQAERILNSGLDRQLLKVLREETVLVVLMVRIEMQARREEYEQENA